MCTRGLFKKIGFANQQAKKEHLGPVCLHHNDAAIKGNVDHWEQALRSDGVDVDPGAFAGKGEQSKHTNTGVLKII